MVRGDLTNTLHRKQCGQCATISGAIFIGIDLSNAILSNTILERHQQRDNFIIIMKATKDNDQVFS